MSVQFIDGKGVDAELKGTDSGADVAVIAVKKSDVPEETRAKIRIAEVGDSNALKVGQGVIAIGNALGYGQSVTVGYVSAMGRSITARDTATGETATIKNLLQTDAAINPGNSGGALLNMHGQVIGINESKSVDTTVEGMGYAIPILSVTDLIDNLSAQKTRAQVAEQDRGYIGFQGQNVDQEAARKFNMPVGIFVYKILKGGAAANSKLQESDIITKFEGQTVSSIEELKDKLTRYQKGEVVQLLCPLLIIGDHQLPGTCLPAQAVNEMRLSCICDGGHQDRSHSGGGIPFQLLKVLQLRQRVFERRHLLRLLHPSVIAVHRLFFPVCDHETGCFCCVSVRFLHALPVIPLECSQHIIRKIPVLRLRSDPDPYSPKLLGAQL